MKTIMFALLCATVPLGMGCKKTGSAGEAMSKMTEYRDRMCACADTACAQKVSDDMSKWGHDQSKTNQTPSMSADDSKKLSQINEDTGRCMQKAMASANGAAMTGSAMGGDTTGTTGTMGTNGTGATGTGTTGTGNTGAGDMNGTGTTGTGTTGTGAAGTTGTGATGTGTTGSSNPNSTGGTNSAGTGTSGSGR